MRFRLDLWRKRLEGWIGARTQQPRLPDIQGGILQGYGRERVAYVFLRVTDPGEARAWLGRLSIDDARRYKKRTLSRNVAVTYRGLEALGVDERLLTSFAREFRQGMKSRAVDVLGDEGASHPDHWDEVGPHSDGAHVLVMLQAEEDLEDEVEELLSTATGAEGLFVQYGQVLAGNREHFGFSDGFAQPSLRNVRYDKRPGYRKNAQPKGNGVPLRFGRWRRMALGEFVLGYYDEDNVKPQAPRGKFGDDGTYMVWRKLEQDVDGFESFIDDAVEKDRRHLDRVVPGLGHEERVRWLKARVVGRWQNGTPLAQSPHREDPNIAGNPKKLNTFRYGKDALGERCPVGAHVRRTNPRDALRWGHKRSSRHRIIRNGFPYTDKGVNGRAGGRGLIFVCYNASIHRQFEVVQGAWSGDGRVFGLGFDRDPLVGEPVADGGKFLIGGKPPYFLAPLQQFVTTRGGEYLFMPGLPALRALAAGTESELAGLDTPHQRVEERDLAGQ